MIKTTGLTLIFLFAALVIDINAQDRPGNNQPQGGEVTKKEPTIFLSFEKSVRKSFTNKNESDRVYFRFHNNTRWGVRLDASGEDRVFGNTQLFYDVLKALDEVETRVECHVCSMVILKPCQSILFSIPYTAISKAYAIRISFNYEWEDSISVASGREPTHFVFFYMSDLPK